MTGPRTEPAQTTTDPASSTLSSLSIDRLDVIAPGAFAAAVAPLFEGARHFLGRLAMARPFGTIDRLFEAARAIANAMPVDEQIELIDAHPRLGAPPGAVSALSFVEQGYHRDGPAAPARATEAAPGTEIERVRVAAEIECLNDAYQARFGFRYCVFVAGRPLSALIPGMTAALEADRAAEVERALDAVVDIAAERYATLTAAAEDQA